MLLLFFFIVVPTQSLVEEIAPTVEGSEVIITEEKEPSEKHYGLVQGWKDYSTFSFKHSVNIPTKTIRNEASFRLASGSYRVKIGGSFITAKNGKYDALANGPFYFTVK